MLKIFYFNKFIIILNNKQKDISIMNNCVINILYKPKIQKY